jgi:hypothetical protein
VDIREEKCVFSLLIPYSYRGTDRTVTPCPGVGYLVPIEAPVPQDKGKGREVVEAMDEGKSEKAWSPSLTVSEYATAFHQGEDSAFVYNWTDDDHGDSQSDLDVKETEWLMDQLYFNAEELPL